MATYPATNLTEATELVIEDSGVLHEVINGGSTETVEVDDGPIPTLRKSLADNFYYKDPIDWLQGSPVTEFNQLVKFTDDTLWVAPSARGSNPVFMGVTPVGDPLWEWSPVGNLSITPALTVPDVYLPLSNKVVDSLYGGLNYSRPAFRGNINKSSVVEQLGPDELGITTRGVSLYTSYTNYFLNPQSPVTQVITLVAGTYTLIVHEAGSDGIAAATGYGVATIGTPITFTTVGEALTVAITGTVTLCNLINLGKTAPPILDAAEATAVADTLDLPMMNNLPAAGQPFSIVFTVAIPNLGVSATVLATASLSSTTGFFVNRVGTGSVRFATSDGVSRTSLDVTLDEEVHKIIVVYTGSAKLIYIDGTLAVSQSLVEPIVYDSAVSLLLGSSDGIKHLNSELAEVEIHHAALSAEEAATRGGA